MRVECFKCEKIFNDSQVIFVYEGFYNDMVALCEECYKKKVEDDRIKLEREKEIRSKPKKWKW